MTTNAQEKRRTRVVGAVLALLGLATIGQAIYAREQDAAQKACFEGQLSQFSSVLNQRADLAGRESAATRGVIESFVAAARIPDDAPRKEQEASRDAIIDSLENYDTELTAVAAFRKENPLPEFPPGTCDQ